MERKLRRVFIALNLPQELKDRIKKWQKKHWDMPVRWIMPENMHLTLLFVGWVVDVAKIQHAVQETVIRHSSPTFTFTHIDYGPPQGSPLMFWLYGDQNEALALIRKDLKQELSAASMSFESQDHALLSHVTIGRMREYEWREKYGRVRPDIGIRLPFSFMPKSLDLMESHLKKSGAEYKTLYQAPFRYE